MPGKEPTDEGLEALRIQRKDRMHLLTPEQRKIVEEWDSRTAKWFELTLQAAKAWEEGDSATSHRLFDEASKFTTTHCAHERSIWKPCSDCNAIERILHPDWDEDEDEGYA